MFGSAGGKPCCCFPFVLIRVWLSRKTRKMSGDGQFSLFYFFVAERLCLVQFGM